VTFSGLAAENIVRIQCNGGLTVHSTLLSAFSVSSFSDISAPDLASAEELTTDFFSSDSQFSLRYYWNFWNCPHEEVTATILDVGTVASPYILDLVSQVGDVTVDPFFQIFIQEADMAAYSGSVSVGGLKVSDRLHIFASGGSITVNATSATIVDLVTSNGGVTFDWLIATEVDVTTTNSVVSSRSVVLKSGPDCMLDIQTSNGQVLLDLVTLPSDVVCDIDITSTNGNVDLTLVNFAGSYDLRTSNGQISVTGQSCGSQTRCTGTVAGTTVSHSLTVKTSNAAVTVTLV